MMSQEEDSYVILYDGVCALCNGLIRFILRFDRNGKFRFSSLQGDYAQKTLARHLQNPLDPDTVVLVAKNEDGEERLFSKSEAVIFTLERLGGLFRLAAAFLRPWPTTFLDRAYDTIAKYRYRVFGRLDSCPLPDPGYADRFMESPQDRKPPEIS